MSSQLTFQFDTEPEPPPVIAAPIKVKKEKKPCDDEKHLSQLQGRATQIYKTLTSAYRDKACTALAQRRLIKTKEKDNEVEIGNWQCWIEILQKMARLQAGKPLPEDSMPEDGKREAYEPSWSYPLYVSPNAKGANL